MKLRKNIAIMFKELKQWIYEISALKKARLDQKSLRPAKRRVMSILKKIITRRPEAHNDVFLVNIKDNKFKRLIVKDAYLASKIANNLAVFRSSNFFPELIWEHENELWFEYIEGKSVTSIDENFVKQAGFFYSAIYNAEPVKVAVEKFGFDQITQSNLRFLNKVSIISDALLCELIEMVNVLSPKHVWVGYDYTDPFLFNFIITPNGQLRAIDVKSLRANCLIGCGVAKALAVWEAPYGEQILVEINKKIVPDFMSYLPFIELYYLSGWMKRSFLFGRQALVKPSFFDRIRRNNKS